MPLLTTYRPNFCSECGRKIVRLRWFLWHSRRFCDRCSSRFRKQRLLQPAVVAVGLVIFGLIVGRAFRQAPPPLILKRVESAPTGPPNLAQPTVIEDQVYICGARTKKGTPCSRRVHGPVRCWQHKGLRAMLPQEKLLVKE